MFGPVQAQYPHATEDTLNEVAAHMRNYLSPAHKVNVAKLSKVPANITKRCSNDPHLRRTEDHAISMDGIIRLVNYMRDCVVAGV